MTKFHFKQGLSTNPAVVLRDKDNGALILSTEVDGDSTAMLCIPYEMLSKLFVSVLPTAEIELTPMTASFDSSGSLTVE